MSIRNLQVIQDLPFNIKPYQDITDTLPTRLPDTEPVRTPEQITHISVHHSAVEGGTIQGYADYHVNTLKWHHIGYHLVIKGDQTFQVNDLMTFSYHTSSNNSYTIGISVSGDLSKRPLSEVERNNLYGAILTIMDLFKIPVANVMGHNEYPENNTSCPCIDMNNLRSDIAKLQTQMKAASDPSKIMDKCYRATNQHLWLYNEYKKDPVANKWVEPKLLQLNEWMDELNMFFEK
jgi:hypothetical protein